MAAVTNINTDQYALLALKDHITHNPNNLLAKNWSRSTFVCNWIGVTCGVRHQRVMALNMSDFGLTGTIPPQLGNLTFLTLVDIKNNSFHGSLPEEFARLRRLKFIDFTSNNFSTEIPSWLASLPKLQHLILNQNSFKGTIPPFLGNISSLQELRLMDNKLSGGVPKELGRIPRDIGNLTFAIALAIGYNNLTGEIPYEIGNLQNLQLLRIQNSNLVGIVPPSIFNISTLREVALANNKLSGGIPSSIDIGLPNLEGLFLPNNNLSGIIPTSISNLSNLVELELGSNSFSGEEDSMTKTLTLATIGYMAPEYGSEGIVSARSDVYSFGILMMETFTRKKPTDNMFVEGISMKCWVEEALPHAVTQVADADLLLGDDDQENFNSNKDCILSILELAVNCSVDLAEKRIINITNVLATLKHIRAKVQKNVRTA
ncbi:hypothetical protein LWI28_019615 [Acer negundo]|uniref:Leucine-rich repeat-containing N-terminal plant-type domain-containing protein n=1 Tax=Acer negundo TaxID=4023 RepID=A0AAD5IF10_ACENE|nr:hypothetical protein LWI28_019615 [Acer negundo]